MSALKELVLGVKKMCKILTFESLYLEGSETNSKTRQVSIHGWKLTYKQLVEGAGA